jgi:hypothetical protein
MNCRFCNTPLKHVFIDLANSPASNSFLTRDELNEPEAYYPLKVYTCHSCFLVQIDEFKKSDDIFNDEYVYFSSFSKSWLAHSEAYTEQMIDRFGYNSSSLVVEIASNDGYLLQYFNNKGIPVLGIEPTANTAKVAREKGIESIVEFFGVRLAKELANKQKKANLLLGNNVLAHVPDINDFVGGMKVILEEQGTITMEFPHLIKLIQHAQFDTIYHEHFSYLSFYTVKKVFEKHGLEMFDVEEIPTHGGSLRIFAKHMEDDSKQISINVTKLLEYEIDKGVANLDYYILFQEKAEKIKIDLLRFLIDQKLKGKTVAAYGAAAKGNTLLNFCGVKSDLISFVVDANPSKQNKFLPGSHIPVVSESFFECNNPDYILIFPWNIKTEIIKQLAYLKSTRFVIAIPELTVL